MTDKQRLVQLLADAPRFRTNMRSSAELGVLTLGDIYATLTPLNRWFDAAASGCYQLGRYHSIHISEYKWRLQPFYDAPTWHHVVSITQPTLKPIWMPERVYAERAAESIPLLLDCVEQRYGDWLHEAWTCVIESRLPRTLGWTTLREEVWYALGMDLHQRCSIGRQSVWPLLEVPLVQFVGAVAARDDELAQRYVDLLDAISEYIPIGRMEGTNQFGGTILSICA